MVVLCFGKHSRLTPIFVLQMAQVFCELTVFERRLTGQVGLRLNLYRKILVQIQGSFSEYCSLEADHLG